MYINDSGAPVTLEAVPFNGCNPAGTGLEVTFNVDMSSEGDIAAGNVYMAGFHTDWGPDILSLPNKDGDIHSGTLRLPTPSDYTLNFNTNISVHQVGEMKKHLDQKTLVTPLRVQTGLQP